MNGNRPEEEEDARAPADAPVLVRADPRAPAGGHAVRRRRPVVRTTGPGRRPMLPDRPLRHARPAQPRLREYEVKAVAVYESVFGNTHAIAEAVAEGLGGVPVLSLREAVERAGGLDLLVVGGPAPRARAGERTEAVTSPSKVRMSSPTLPRSRVCAPGSVIFAPPRAGPPQLSTLGPTACR